MCSLNAEIYQKFNVYTKSGQHHIKCLTRGIEIPINQRPEELVRQIFLHFLINESGLLSNKINIKVEANHHDIEIYKKQVNHNFQPYQNPLMIVEIKREDVNLQNHHEQIQKYLKQSGCNIGVLYNYHEIIGFTRQDNNWTIHYLKSLRDIIEKLILSKIPINNDFFSEFEQAQKGNFESFSTLITKYARYTTHRVVFKVKQQQSKIEGYLFDIQENKIHYKECGQYAKKKSFDRQDFEKLISITY